MVRVSSMIRRAVFHLHQRRWQSSGNTITKPELLTILQSFDAPIRFCCAYGSAVFPQRINNTASSEKQVDFIFGVTHPEHWHSLNLRQNRHHYSPLMRTGGSGLIAAVQQSLGASIYYNQGCLIDGKMVKYGVVAMDDLIRDLTDWTALYCAGRMQKPVLTLRQDARVQLAQRINMSNALRTSMLLLPAQFSEEDLFLTLCKLSYTGDFRMTFFGEDPHKIYNIVFRQMELFHSEYSPLVDELPHIDYIAGKQGSQLQQNMAPKARLAIFRQLPPRFRQLIIMRYQSKTADYFDINDNDGLMRLLQHPNTSQHVDYALGKIVGWPAFTQSIKGFLTAGFVPAIRYARRKFSKSINAKPPASQSK